MKVVAISDTHFKLDEKQCKELIPDGDVLIHAGDLMYTGYPDEWQDRLDFLESLPHKKKIYVPGNHDFHVALYGGSAVEQLLKIGVTPLCHLKYDYVLPNGMRIVGVPFMSNMIGWAFNTAEDQIYDFLIYRYMHKHIDIMVTHSPMHGVLDNLDKPKIHVGNMAFEKFFNEKKVKPKYWIHGHIHERYGQEEVDGCTFINAAMCDLDYKPVNKGIEIQL